MPRTPVAVAFSVIALLALAACAPKRPVESEDVLLARRAQLQQEVTTATAAGIELLARQVHAERERNPDATVDVLVISGGGDWGAFGTGFLIGWARPRTPRRAAPPSTSSRGSARAR